MTDRTRLLINIDHVATLRNARRETFPDPVAAALACERAGADGIVFHLREDRRHITDDDVRRLKDAVRTKLDFELSMADEIVGICCATRPDLATLVPERREEVTTEGGLDVVRQVAHVRTVVDRLHAAGIAEVALFVDPEPDQIEAAAATGADAVELHTGDFARSVLPGDVHRECTRIGLAARAAADHALVLHAGHGLDYVNYRVFRAAAPGLSEVSIGFAIIARALITGLDQAVREMAALVHQPS